MRVTSWTLRGQSTERASGLLSRIAMSARRPVVRQRRPGRASLLGGLARKPSLLLTLCGLIAVACGDAAAPPPTATPEPTPAPAPRVSLPRDDGPHSSSLEWWYYNGQMTADDGTRYGFHLVFFEILPPGQASLVRIGHFALTDHQRGTYSTAQEVMPRTSEPPASGFLATTGELSASGNGGHDALAASAAGYDMRVTLSPGKPAVLHDGDGLVDFPPAGDSFYYSRTRMSGTGTIVDHGVEKRVSVQSWMDHQWGDFALLAIGWDWLSLQLDDSTELMLSIVRNTDGEVIKRFGTMVDAAGAATHLGPDDFEVDATGPWTSPRTGATYPLIWRVAVPQADLTLTLNPIVEDSEFDSRTTTLNYYWEGEVSGEGRREGEPVSAVGFVELVGY